MAIFKCLVTSNYGSKGELVDVKGVEHDKLSSRQSAILKPHVDVKPKVVETKTTKK